MERNTDLQFSDAICQIGDTHPTSIQYEIQAPPYMPQQTNELNTQFTDSNINWGVFCCFKHRRRGTLVVIQSCIDASGITSSAI